MIVTMRTWRLRKAPTTVTSTPALGLEEFRRGACLRLCPDDTEGGVHGTWGTVSGRAVPLGALG